MNLSNFMFLLGVLCLLRHAKPTTTAFFGVLFLIIALMAAL